MFDFLRNLTKSAPEKRRERLNAYLDGELSPRERRRFEQELEEDEALRASLDELRWIKLNVQQLPRVRAPRNFTLDPAVYGQRAPAPSWQLYPALRVATALTAFFFVLAVAADLLTPAGALSQPLAQLQAPQVSQVRELEGEANAVGAEEAAEAESMAEPAEEVVEEPAEEEAAEPMLEAAEAEEETDGAQQEGAAATADDESSESIASDEATEAAEESAPEASGPGALAATPQVTATPTEDGQRVAAVTAEPTVTAPPAADRDTPEPPSPPASFPFLLLAEIILGAALLVLALVTLRARRNR
jgi:hypothetical protein